MKHKKEMSLINIKNKDNNILSKKEVIMEIKELLEAENTPVRKKKNQENI